MQIRDSAEPAEMPVGTTISGTNTDGALTAGTLTVPTISFVFEVTDPAPTKVDVEAAFSLVTPNSLIGSIDPDRMVRATARLKVDLTLRVELLPGQVFHCSSSPVVLVLEGHHDGEQVTLVDEDFAVPAFPTTETCSGLITGGLNNVLQGAGHSLSLTMAGPLTAPLHPGAPTTTALAVSPAEGSRVGEEVTLTATVAPEEGDTVPGGLVAFRDGSTVIDTVALDGTGTATLATTALAAGPRRLNAQYLGTPPDHAASVSATTLHTVTAGPIVTVDLPAALLVGGDPVDGTITVTNSGYGADIGAGRLRVSIRRPRPGGGPLVPVAGTPRVTLAVVDGETATPVELTVSGVGSQQTLTGYLDPSAGAHLPIGAERVVSLRLATASALDLGAVQVVVALVDPAASDAILAESTRLIDVIGTDRADVTLTAGRTAIPPPPLPPLVPAGPAVVPVRARAGTAVVVQNLRATSTINTATPPTGTMRFSIDGRVLSARDLGAGAGVGWSELHPYLVNSNTVQVVLPVDVGVGVKQLAVTYSGDLYYKPSTAVFPVTVDPPVGPTYECQLTAPGARTFLAQIEARAVMPAATVPGPVDLTGVVIRVRMPRAPHIWFSFRDLPADPDATVGFEVGPDGAGRAAGIVIANPTEMVVDEPSAVDYTVTLDQPEGQVQIDGAPGEVVPVTLDALNFRYIESLGRDDYLYSTRCLPVDGAMVLGEVTVAGTVLEAPAVVAADGEASLSAVGHPGGPGVVEFQADGQTVGFAPTTDGTAAVSTFDLPAGSPEVRAIFYPSGPAPITVSEPATVRVIATCAPLEEGTGATVRLVYMQLLGRCPDAAGYAYWVGQLDGGLDRAVFAQRISASLEARKVIVADAYRLLLDRAPDAAGATFWAERLGRNARYDDLLASIAASPEFRSLAGGTDTGVVARLYERIIGRAPDSAGRDYWVGVLRSRGITQVVRSFVNLPEPLAAIVTGSYEDVLDRAPTTEERTAAVDALRTTGDRSALYASIIAMDDFADRAQTFPELT